MGDESGWDVSVYAAPAMASLEKVSAEPGEPRDQSECTPTMLYNVGRVLIGRRRSFRLHLRFFRSFLQETAKHRIAVLGLRMAARQPLLHFDKLLLHWQRFVLNAMEGSWYQIMS